MNTFVTQMAHVGGLVWIACLLFYLCTQTCICVLELQLWMACMHSAGYWCAILASMGNNLVPGLWYHRSMPYVEFPLHLVSSARKHRLTQPSSCWCANDARRHVADVSSSIRTAANWRSLADDTEVNSGTSPYFIAQYVSILAEHSPGVTDNTRSYCPHQCHCGR